MLEKTSDLNHLHELCKLTPVRCAYFGEAACVCLERKGHASGVRLKMIGDFEGEIILKWNKLDPTVFESWINLEETVEDAAYGLAITMVSMNTPYEIIKQSAKGSNVDFWCAEKNGDYPFQNAVRLEVSGILHGSMGQINFRLKEKKIQAENGEVPYLVLVAEFSRPLVKSKMGL